MKENFINRIPLKVYRRLRWEKDQHKSYRHIASSYGKAYAQMCYDCEKAIYLNRPMDEVHSLLKKRDNFILDDIQKKCNAVLQNVAQYRVNSDACRDSNEPIWVFWWTGEDSASEIVKACIKSIRRNANGHSVNFIDKYNIGKYVQFPAHIDEKHERGIIGHAAFADILRVTLLAQYGGVWIDATCFISQPLPDLLFRDTFFTAKSVDNNAYYFSRSRWVGYFLAGNRHFALFSFVRDMLFEYWKETDEIVAYLLLDYIIDIAYHNFPEVQSVMDTLPNNNLARGQLMNRINEPYSAELFSELENGSTFLSKLSWRYGNPVALTKDNKKTNYGHLLEL